MGQKDRVFISLTTTCFPKFRLKLHISARCPSGVIAIQSLGLVDVLVN